MIGTAGGCFVFPEASEILCCDGITFKFQMDPGIICRYIVEILVHLPRLKLYQFGWGNIFGFAGNSEQRHQFLAKILRGGLQGQILMMKIPGLRLWFRLFLFLLHTASFSCKPCVNVYLPFNYN